MHANLLRPIAAAAAIALLAGCSSDGPTGPRTTPLTGTLAVGDLVQVNVNADSDCTAPVYHVARVEAIGSKAMILNDTLNPKNGFTTADFERFAAKFDTLIYPIDGAAFGEPTDIDNNGHIGLIFTRAVNELTPAGSSSYVGGFTYSRDLFPQQGNARAQACPASNEGEYFYLLAPDPNGEINGNRRSTAFVDAATTPVIAHEFQHLINASRKLYVNVAATEFEEKWLDEGLAHVAEELLFYHESGYTPRNNLGINEVTATAQSFAAYNSDMRGNEGRYKSYLQSPSINSPYNLDDSLATRGSAWSFLRYLADQKALATAPTASASMRRTGSGTVSVPGGVATTDYAAVVVNSSTNPVNSAAYTLRADNVLTSVSPVSGGLATSRSVLLGGASANAPQPDQAFESRLRDRERRLMPLHSAAARSWFFATRPGALMHRASFANVPGTSVDGNVWFNLVNATITGVANVQSAFGVNVGTAVRDWSVSNQVDDAASFVPPEYLQPSWNWHSIYPNVPPTGSYPLAVRTLPNGTTLSGSVIGGGAGYFRFTAPIGGTSTVTLTDQSGAAASNLQLVVVRIR
jgi:hypothetical protein